MYIKKDIYYMRIIIALKERKKEDLKPRCLLYSFEITKNLEKLKKNVDAV